MTTDDRVLVPRKPTDEMLRSVRGWSVGCCHISDDDAADIYEAMTDAAALAATSEPALSARTRTATGKSGAEEL